MIVDKLVNLEDNELQNRKFFTLNTIKGDKGDIGKGFQIDFVFNSLSDLLASSSENGKVALDIETRNYYFRQGSAWVKVGVLEGIQGEVGPKGEQGPEGKQGLSIKGEKGDKGERGIQGIQGLKGLDGIDGEKGNRGEAF